MSVIVGNGKAEQKSSAKKSAAKPKDTKKKAEQKSSAKKSAAKPKDTKKKDK